MTGGLLQPWMRVRWALPACLGVLGHHVGAPAQVVRLRSPPGQGGLQRSRLLHRAPGEEVLGPTKGPQEWFGRWTEAHRAGALVSQWAWERKEDNLPPLGKPWDSIKELKTSSETFTKEKKQWTVILVGCQRPWHNKTYWATCSNCCSPSESEDDAPVNEQTKQSIVLALVFWLMGNRSERKRKKNTKASPST